MRILRFFMALRRGRAFWKGKQECFWQTIAPNHGIFFRFSIFFWAWSLLWPFVNCFVGSFGLKRLGGLSWVSWVLNFFVGVSQHWGLRGFGYLGCIWCYVSLFHLCRAVASLKHVCHLHKFHVSSLWKIISQILVGNVSMAYHSHWHVLGVPKCSAKDTGFHYIDWFFKPLWYQFQTQTQH